ncbi:uncharacterized protein LOC124142127 [Haliotis rufescens]|uniref:uncharacterized protein LOC124142127 n=1 Tax=Haliotis rufescens TaxID=6454 RepID=UPI00201EE40A|nr:uncharacterized protein LOC124142127 [Haliotis rufescens]
MSSSKEDLRQIISSLSSASSSKVYNALVHVRTKAIKSQTVLKKILSQGLIPQILKILDNADTTEKKPKIADIALSILGNLCMEPDTRNDVITRNGVEALARHLLESSVESIQNRSCRGLANLALTPSACSQIISLETLPRVVKLLDETKSKECKLTYCRAFRLLGRVRDNQRRVVESGAVLQVAKLLKHDDAEIAKCALRTLSELIKPGCCSSFARQIIGANILDKLVSTVDSDNDDDSHDALSTLYNLTNQADVRAAIGAAGGIQLFVRLLQQENNRSHINEISVINALCLCGKEAVNRIKIRQQGGLELFINVLREPKFAQIHDRVISGLVCFLYDFDSMDVLLENNLVEVLLIHLQRCGDFKSSVETIRFPNHTGRNKSLKPSEKLSTSRVKCEVSLCSLNEDQSDLCLEADASGTDERGALSLRPKDLTIDQAYEVENEDIESVPLDRASFQGHPPKQLHKFSIDSPSYEVNTEWNLENFAGQTCKQSFSQHSDLRSPSPEPPLSPLSPLSNDTYFSPAQSSPSYSLPRSPESLPGSPSASNLDSEYHPVLSVPYTCGSPEKAPSDSESTSAVNVDQQPCYSSTEEDDICDTIRQKDEAEKDEAEKDEDCPSLDTTSTDVSSEKIEKPESVEDSEPREDETVEVISKNVYGKRPLALRSPSYKLVESCTKRKKTESKRSDIMKTTEHNLLILLSRISVKTNPSMYLITSTAMSCLLDYLFYVPLPHSRCVRTMSRLFKNPHCLESCLLLTVPVIIYKKIILDVDGIDKETYEHFSQRSSHSRRCSRVSTSSEDSFCGGYLTNLENSYPGSTSGTKDNALDFTHGLLASPTSPRSETEISFKVGQSPMSQNAAELSVADVGQSGLSLLKDLSFSAESPYGKGIISSILVRGSQKDKLLCTVSLLFLCWGSVMQKQYLIRYRVLDTVLELLKAELLDPGPVFMAIVAGLTFICKLNSIPLKLKQERSDTVFKPATQSEISNSDQCIYEGLDVDLVFKVDSKQIHANREKLVQSSAMFLAMLEGHYSESSQSEIAIQDTSPEALEYVLHYLQGCSLGCSVMKKVNSDTDDVTVEFLLDALALADRFLLSDLVQYLKVSISSHHLDSESCATVFGFASFHEFSDLASDCVKVVLCSPISLSDKSQLLAQMLSGECAEIFVEMLKTVLREGTQ